MKKKRNQRIWINLDRRIEIIAECFSFGGRAHLAVDTTLFPHSRELVTRMRGRRGGTRNELTPNSSGIGDAASLSSGLTLEDGGAMKQRHFSGSWPTLKPAKPHSLTNARIHRWSAMFTHAAMHAFAVSLLDQNLFGLPQHRRQRPFHQRDNRLATADSHPPITGTGLDLAISYAHPAAGFFEWLALGLLPGEEPVKQSLLLGILQSKRSGAKKTNRTVEPSARTNEQCVFLFRAGFWAKSLRVPGCECAILIEGGWHNVCAKHNHCFTVGNKMLKISPWCVFEVPLKQNTSHIHHTKCICIKHLPQSASNTCTQKETGTGLHIWVLDWSHLITSP